MKLNVYLSFIFISALCFVMMSSRNGRANEDRAGTTGAPGDRSEGGLTTCAGCHGGGTFQPSLIVEAKDNKGNLVTKFRPNDTINFSVTINTASATNPSSYGFQMLALAGANNTPANTWFNQGSNTRITSLTSGGQSGRTYVEQLSPSSTKTFTASWRAPSNASGNVTFYVSGIATNGNNGTSGDSPVNTTLVLSNATSSSDLESKGYDWNIIQNSTNQNLDLSLNSPSDEILDYQILDIKGQVLSRGKWGVTLGQNRLSLSLGGVPSGVYLISLQDSQRFVSTKKYLKW
jgi:hypothetical protein